MKKIFRFKFMLIFLLITCILTLSILFGLKHIVFLIDKKTLKECSKLTEKDTYILNSFFELSYDRYGEKYNGDKNYWCSLREINPRILHNYKNNEIPKELGNLINLKIIDLNGKGLKGEIPKELGNLTELIFLFLNNNDLTGEIPKELGNLENLIGINLANNKLTGEIPKELINGNKVEYINLINNLFNLKEINPNH